VKSPYWLCSSLVVLSLLPSAASAGEPTLLEWAKRRVQDGLVKPLANQSGRRFSRERPPPAERRVRVTRETATSDSKGGKFLTFAIDVRYGTDWQEDDVVGCVYAGTGSLFVKNGDEYRPAAFLLGKKADPVAGVCEAAPPARS
jgi:hypothetical protein